VLLCLKTKKEPASKTVCFYIKLEDGQSPKKDVSFYFSLALFHPLDFLTLEDSTYSLSWNSWYGITILCCI